MNPATLAPTAITPPGRPASTPAAATHYVFDIELLGTEPRIWRRILAYRHVSFGWLHDAIQAACGWQDDHLWEFNVPATRSAIARTNYSPLGDPLPQRTHVLEPDDVMLAEWFDRNDTCNYLYDFGDRWLHRVTCTDRLIVDDPRPGEPIVVQLLAGARAFPLDDCGGVREYERMVQLLFHNVDPGTGTAPSPDLVEEMREWAGDWEPERFDFAAVADDLLEFVDHEIDAAAAQLATANALAARYKPNSKAVNGPSGSGKRRKPKKH